MHTKPLRVLPPICLKVNDIFDVLTPLQRRIDATSLLCSSVSPSARTDYVINGSLFGICLGPAKNIELLELAVSLSVH